MGEEVAEYNGAYKVSQGMLAEFGPKRVLIHLLPNWVLRLLL
jgi:pyruvate/2-oxoglutarate/acetoin dehydrogenase E1 component